MGKNRKNSSKRKRKQTGTPSPGRYSKMADNSSSDSKQKQNQQPVSTTPQSEHPLPTSNVYSAAHQTLYGAPPGYPLTPYQPPVPHTTPAHMIYSPLQQFPSMSLPPPSPAFPDLERFMSEVTNRLKKLDLLDDILSRLVNMETHCQTIDNEILDIREQLKRHTINFSTMDQGLTDMHNKVQDIDRQNMKLYEENCELKERVVQQQSRSMRDNLIFKGIPDDYNPVEDTEGKIKDFIKSELGIEDEINFHVVHRLKPKQDKSPRGIVAKFERRKDRNKVLSKAIAKLKNNKQFIVHEQYPIEIIDRRRQLVPIMKDARGKGHEAVLKEDRLYIDKRRFYPRPFVSSFNHPPPPPPPPPAAVPINVQPPVTRG